MIYIDMDSVVTDFDLHFSNSIGIIIDEWKEKFYLQNPDKNHSEKFWTDISKIKNFWEDMPPMKDFQIFWNFFSKHEVQILTAVPEKIETERAKKGKTFWVHKYLGDNIPINFTVSSWTNYNYSGKEIYCKNKFDILIDDSLTNTKDWINKGGIGILHKSAKETIEKFKLLT